MSEDTKILNAAYNEAMGLGPAENEIELKEEETPGDNTEETSGDEQENTESAGQDNGGEDDISVEVEAEPSGEAESDGESTDDGVSERERELLEEVAKLQQKTLTYAGRVKKAERELSKRAAKKVENIFDEAGNLSEGFETLKEDYPEVAALETALQKQQEQIKKYQDELLGVDEKINIINQQVQEVRGKEALNQRFPGYENKLAKNGDVFAEWLHRNAPPDEINNIVYSSDPEYVGQYLEAFDRETGVLTGNGRLRPQAEPQPSITQEQAKREEALKASLGVTTRTAATAVNEGQPKEDLKKLLEDAYNEAMRT